MKINHPPIVFFILFYLLSSFLHIMYLHVSFNDASIKLTDCILLPLLPLNDININLLSFKKSLSFS